jgi:hypothetical protein
MNKRFFVLLATVALPAVALAQGRGGRGAASASAPTGPAILLVPDRVWDGVDAAPHDGWGVIVRGDRIEAVGPRAQLSVPADATTIAIPGTTLMPGLIEGHSHLLLHPYNETPWDDQVLHEALALRVARAVNHARATLMDELDPPRLSCAPQAAPERFETGTQSHEDMAGVAAAVDFLAGLAHGATRRERLEQAYGALAARGDELLEQLWTGLESIPRVRLFGPRPGTPRTPTVSFVIDGHDARAVAEHLSSRCGLFLSSGSFYAAHVLEDLGVNALVRAGCMCYTTASEVDRLVEGVAGIAGG